MVVFLLGDIAILCAGTWDSYKELHHIASFIHVEGNTLGSLIEI